MLILSRKHNESLVIEVEGQDEPIEIIVTELGANQVRLGINARQGCKIWRKELYQTVQYNKQAATEPVAGIRDVAARLSSKPEETEKPKGQE